MDWRQKDIFCLEWEFKTVYILQMKRLIDQWNRISLKTSLHVYRPLIYDKGNITEQ